MQEWMAAISELIRSEQALAILRAALFALGGVVAVRLTGRALGRALPRHFDPHSAQIARRIVVSGLIVLFGMGVLHQLGFELGVLLGAAGVLTVAIGFASQTSASNLVSGLFLIAEQPFGVGDVIRVSGTTGEVLSIDLLSVKLRTFDNLFVRIPNETLIKSEVTNLTRFPIRRLDLAIGVAYKEDLARVETVLRDVANRNPLCLEEPVPLFMVLGYGDSAVNLQLSVWVTRTGFLDLRNSIQREILEAFTKAGIEIPFPHRSLYTGSVTEPMPIRLVGGGALPESPAP